MATTIHHQQQEEAGTPEGMRISLLVAFPMPGTLPVDVVRGKKRREKRRHPSDQTVTMGMEFFAILVFKTKRFSLMVLLILDFL